MSTDTKPSAKTTEFLVFLAGVTAVVATAMMVGQHANTGIDPFGAQDGLRHPTYLTIGYMVTRGLAKSGNAPTSSAPLGVPAPVRPDAPPIRSPRTPSKADRKPCPPGSQRPE